MLGLQSYQETLSPTQPVFSMDEDTGMSFEAPPTVEEIPQQSMPTPYDLDRKMLYVPTSFCDSEPPQLTGSLSGIWSSFKTARVARAAIFPQRHEISKKSVDISSIQADYRSRRTYGLALSRTAITHLRITHGSTRTSGSHQTSPRSANIYPLCTQRVVEMVQKP